MMITRQVPNFDCLGQRTICHLRTTADSSHHATLAGSGRGGYQGSKEADRPWPEGWIRAGTRLHDARYDATVAAVPDDLTTAVTQAAAVSGPAQPRDPRVSGPSSGPRPRLHGSGTCRPTPRPPA